MDRVENDSEKLKQAALMEINHLRVMFGINAEGYIIHALNTVYIEELDKWIRLDARGNKDDIQAQFSLEKEILAFPVRSELGEIDYKDNNPDLDERLKCILSNSRNILEITTSFEMQAR